MPLMTLRHFLQLVEMRTKLVSVSSFAIGTVYAVSETGNVAIIEGVLMFLALLCVDMGTTAFNSYFDFVRGTDRRGHNREEDKVLVHGAMDTTTAFFTSLWLFIIAALVGAILVVMRGPLILVAGLIGLSVGFLYNAGPRPISHSPFGELWAGICLGGIVVLTSAWVQGFVPDVGLLMIGASQSLFVAAILTTNNSCDLEGDRTAGRRTLSIVLGPTGTQILLAGELVAAWALLGLYIGGRDPRAWIAFAVPFFAAAIRVFAMFRGGFRQATKGPRMKDILFCFLCSSAAVVAVTLIMSHRGGQ